MKMAVTQMIVRIDSKAKKKFSKLAKGEGKNASEVLRNLIDDFVKERDIESYIHDLWNRIGVKLNANNIGTKDISNTIREVRAKNK